MAQCPACGNEINEDFGLIECSQCKAPLIVQLDGSLQMAGGENKTGVHGALHDLIIDENPDQHEAIQIQVHDIEPTIVTASNPDLGPENSPVPEESFPPAPHSQEA